MAKNKNALIRYKILDQCFRNPGKRYFIDDLIGECTRVLTEINPESSGISRRQIFEDITFMESPEGWQIDLKRIRDGRKVYYRYEDPAYSINNMPLNAVEINLLKSALQTISLFKGMPQFEWMNEILLKLQQDMDSDINPVPVISFDSNQYLNGIEFLGELFNAISYRKVLRITYQDYKSEQPYELIIHPYYLKQYNNRWFLFGLNQEKNKGDWNLALDRIVNISGSDYKYKENTEFSWDDYFEDIIGVTRPEGAPSEKVLLVFTGDTCRYIISKPVHGSQKVRWNEKNELEVELELIINYELERLILSYADNVKVIYPESLQRKVSGRLDIASQNYR